MSIQRVSQEAGVSVITVSRYLNHPEKVAAKTAERIQKAMRTVGYRPMRGPLRAAPSLAETKKTQRIVVVLANTDPLAKTLSMPVQPKVLGGAAEEAAEKYYGLSFVSVFDDDRLRYYLRPEHCDGVMLYGSAALPHIAPRTMEMLTERLARFPVTHGFYNAEHPYFPCPRVNYNNDMVGVMAADHLRGRGHATVAIVNDSPLISVFTTRAYGCRNRVLQTGGAAVMIEPSITDAPASDDVREVLAPLADALEANLPASAAARLGVFCCSDEMLHGLATILIQRGVPLERFDFIGCDNNSWSWRYFRPRPATMDLHFEDVGREAMRQLLHQLTQHEKATPTATLLPPTLIPGEEITAPPPL